MIHSLRQQRFLRFALLIALHAFTGVWIAAAQQPDPPAATSSADTAKTAPETPEAKSASSPEVKAAPPDQASNAAAKQAAEKASDPVKEVAQKIRSLSLPQMLTWLWNHGPPVAIILAVMMGLLWLANLLHGRLVQLLAGYSNRGSTYEKENRARTLVGVLHNTLRSAVYALAAITILEEVGVPVGPLLGGVAVFGIAVAFGAQSLVKDYFTGFLVLLEQQYMIGDVIKVSGSNFSGVTGQVEQISLRVTTVRDLDGTAHFISHGQISIVSNLTHGWSQAVFDVQVANAEHVERVQKEFCALASTLREDANFGSMILNDAEMLGVDALGDTTFTVKFALRTLPLKRWEVKREMLRRIKQRFDELKIKVIIPA